MTDAEYIPQFHSDDGTLHIASPLQTMRIRWGDPPVAQEWSGEGRWSDFHPEIRLLKPRQPDALLADDKAAAFESFRATVPAPIVELVEPFPSHQWNLMVFLNFSKEAMDLTLSNRVLAYALANNAEIRHVSDRTAWCHAMRNVRKKQREICEELGFPGTEASVQMFRKIPAECAFPPTLRLLKMAIKRDPDILKILGHIKQIRPATIYLASGEEIFSLVTTRLLLQVNESGEEADTSHVADMLSDILHHAGKMRPPPAIPRFSSVRAIRDFHDRLMLELEVQRARVEQARQHLQEETTRYRRMMAATTRKASKVWIFSPPPLPGTVDILPITSSGDLRTEGRLQHNCVGSYTASVRKGAIYVYRVMQPERATVSIRKGYGGSWHIGELKCSCNREASKATRVTVLEWLNRYNLSM